MKERIVTPCCRSLRSIIGKKPEDFQREDLLDVIKKEKLHQINLHYVGLDGKLKEVKVPIDTLEYAERILAQGERIDGSSVFKGIVSTESSDLYILPVYKTAFISPFEDNTLGIICRFLDKDGKLANYTPDNILKKAHIDFQKSTGLTLNALGELEFYIIYDKKDRLFRGQEQRGYHQSSPYIKNRDMINEMMQIISSLTESVKYAHSEVGYIDGLKSNMPEIDGKCCEQYEIEFLPRPIDDMADYLALAKWVIRNVAHRWNCTVTFTPKLEEGMAGSGLHFHLELTKDGTNIMTDSSGALSQEALKLIGGLCKFAPSISAFGNTVASAYLRLVAKQEAPTTICWSECNRSALIRVPLGWTSTTDMALSVNQNQKSSYQSRIGDRQTVEIRSPDGSAYIHFVLAAITTAIKHGLTNPQDSLRLANDYHVIGKDIQKAQKEKGLQSLPSSCVESADILLRDRKFYEENNMFPSTVIDYIAQMLKAEDDLHINERYSHLTAEKRLEQTRIIMHKDIHKQ